MLRFAFILCAQCAPQAALKTAPNLNPAQLSPEFSKSALRALLALNTEPDAHIDSLLNEAQVEAETPTEIKVVDDLRKVRYRMALTLVELKRLIMDKESPTGPKLTALRKQYDDCQSSVEVMIRSKVYSPLGPACTNPLASE